MGRTGGVRLSRRSPALRMLQQARDEAHRFAITFQRARRTARTVTSELLRIPGVGDRKRRQLLEAFGSLQGVRDAAPEAIAALPGFSLTSAQKLLAALHAESTGANGAERPPDAASAAQDIPTPVTRPETGDEDIAAPAGDLRDSEEPA
jgi:excinuclease ABC subunit C